MPGAVISTLVMRPLSLGGAAGVIVNVEPTLADVAGYPRQSRLVGRILSTSDLELPWWRVVNSTGRLVPGHEREQTQLLREEDVVVREGHVRSAPHGRFGDV